MPRSCGHNEGFRADGSCRRCCADSQKRYAASDKNRERHALRQREWRRRNREKVRAHWKVREAVLTGKLIRPIHCEACGRGVDRIEAAHHDYDKPLDVRWLCPMCHHGWDAERHRREKTS